LIFLLQKYTIVPIVFVLYLNLVSFCGENAMTDPISQLGKASVKPDPLVDAKKNDRSDKAAASQSPDSPSKPMADEVVLSKEVERALADADFDVAKVEQIKAAIENGNYPLDKNRIAESFLAVERMIGGK
jgi:flagellar biosynthesis anti-sigma factor FlgM